ncbi:hypothetical protein Y032_0428g1287 [Ancylostoma ceylanicum]|uniref:Uncharacterized protein n=1 Tax=Ancylostoma ceylanicum TaxID=53326 RepID=A0A016X0P1_9BILA|nr:hypothetical protein Y032_0428g1287 [Ancylostoma ceylanicum]
MHRSPTTSQCTLLAIRRPASTTIPELQRVCIIVRERRAQPSDSGAFGPPVTPIFELERRQFCRSCCICD